MNKEDAVAVIRSLLSSTNMSYSVNSLNKDFKNVTGIDIPSFGYKNVNYFLQSLADTVKLSGVYPYQQVCLVANEKSAHIISLVERQKVDSKRKFQRSRQILPVRESLGQIKNEKKISNDKKEAVVSLSQTLFQRKLHHYLKTCPKGATLNEIKYEMKNYMGDEILSNNKILNFVKSCPVFLIFNDKVYDIEIFKNIINSNEIAQGDNLSSQTEEVLKLEQSKDETELKKRVTKTNDNSKNNGTLPLSTNFCQNELQLVPKKPFTNYVKHDELQDHDEDTVAVKQQNRQKNWKSILRKAPLGSFSSSVASNVDDSMLFPEEVLRFGEQIPKINLESNAKVGGYVEVCPCKVYDPHKFYLHFRKYKKKLSQLMNDLQLFYRREKHNEKYEMPDVAIKPTQFCAALYGIDLGLAKWHRAEIETIVADSKVTVSLVDYGKTVEILKKNLRFLHRDFMIQPRQAFLASLANINQLNGESKWSRRAIERFSSLVLHKDLVAGVVNMNKKIPWMSVALSFTKGVEIHINDTLVEEGFAMFKIKESDNQSTVSAGGSNSKKAVEKHISKETFDEIDNLSEQILHCSSTDIKNIVLIHPTDPISDLKKNNRLRQMFSSCKETL